MPMVRQPIVKLYTFDIVSNHRFTNSTLLAFFAFLNYFDNFGLIKKTNFVVSLSIESHIYLQKSIKKTKK